jgi:hypothetical protein
VDIETHDPVRRPRTEAGEAAALALRLLGKDEALLVEIHRPDIALGVQPGGPTLQLGAAVDSRPRAADRFVMDALDEGRIAGRARSKD